jgi:hypothetical protein
LSPPFEGFYLKSSGAKVYVKTMRTYPEELKAKIIARLLPPNNEYIPDVAKETGIPKDTLLSFEDYREDILILAGDITDKLYLFEWCFRDLTVKFKKVLFVPGNHELWVVRDDIASSFDEISESK